MYSAERLGTPRYSIVANFKNQVTLVAKASDAFDRQGKHVAEAALGSDDAGRTRIRLELAPQSQDLNIDAAVKNVLVHARGLQQVLAAEGPLGCVEKGGQQSIFAFGQSNFGPVGVGQTPSPPLQLPAAELAPASLRIAAGHRASGLLPSQHGADARQEFAEAERLRDIVVRAQFQPDDPIDLVAAITGGDDIGTSERDLISRSRSKPSSCPSRRSRITRSGSF